MRTNTKGMFVGAPVRRTIEWTYYDDELGELVTGKIDVRIKRKSFGTISRVLAAKGDNEAWERFIAEAVLLGEEGDEGLTVEQVRALDPAFGNALTEAINDVSGWGAPKNSPPSTSSGTS